MIWGPVHWVRSPVMEMAGVSVIFSLPASWTLTTEAHGSKWRYRELGGRLSSGRQQLATVTFLAWSKTRCEKFGYLKSKPLRLANRQEGYLARDQGELWFCLPLKGEDIAICVVMRFASKAAESTYVRSLHNAKVVAG